MYCCIEMLCSAGALKDFMITLHKHQRMDSRDGEELFNWKGSLGT